MIKLRFTILLSLLFSFSALAMNKPLDFSVMSFNTMCDFCHKNEADSFSKRKGFIKKVVEDHGADLVSLQEVRSGSQVEEIFKDLPDYELFFTDSLLISYADPAIAVNKKAFKTLDNGQFWLGPENGDFSLGWKFALPRQVLWVKVQSLKNNEELLFMATHFDNRVENLLGSSQMVQDFIAKTKIPVVFAGDTNLVPEFEGYSKLLGENLVNAFDGKESMNVLGEVKSEEDLCYHRKGDDFPSCRVDHILLSGRHRWRVSDWTIDARRFGPKKRFPSDHRAVSAKLSLWPSTDTSIKRELATD